MPRLFTNLYLLMLIAETTDMYCEKWSTPLSYLYQALLVWLPIKMSVFEIACMVLAFLSATKAGDKAMERGPMRKAMKVGFLTVFLWSLYGLATGGQAKPINQQLHAYVFALILAFNASTVLKTNADFHRLGRMIVYGAWFRATMGFIFCFLIIPSLGLAGEKYPPYMTTHHDTTLSVLALSILICVAIQTRTRADFYRALFGGIYLLVAIQVNNRRLAWASLGACLIMIYLMLPKNKVKQRIQRALLIMSPIIILYVGIGWERKEAIFAPIRSLSSMGVGKIDASTKARDNENMSMLLMIHERPLIGYGWGQEWIEVDNSYTVPLTTFPMYHYIPHNSVLSTYTFTGLIGFAGMWMPLFVGAFLAARIYRRARLPLDRAAGMSVLCGIVVYMNQLWGDMGIISPIGNCLMGACLGAIARLTVTTGVWPGLPPATAPASAGAAQARAA